MTLLHFHVCHSVSVTGLTSCFRPELRLNSQATNVDGLMFATKLHIMLVCGEGGDINRDFNNVLTGNLKNVSLL